MYLVLLLAKIQNKTKQQNKNNKTKTKQIVFIIQHSQQNN